MTKLEQRWGARVLSVVLVALLALGPGAPLAMAGGSAAGSVEVASDPDGASVYVDGRFEGTTPLRVDGVAPGPHRVRVVKEGFLENRRVVDVEAGRAHGLKIPLTEHAPDGARFQVDPSSSGGGGGSKKALLIGLGAAAVGTGLFFALRDTNDPPAVTGVTASPTTALQSVTAVTFSVQASDPDGDTLTYTWDFGDGTTGSGATTTHVFDSSGSFDASVTVSDGEETASGRTSVTVRNLTGTWTGNVDNISETFFTWTLNQQGTNISGTYSDPANGTGSATGSISGNQVILQNRIPGFRAGNWRGTLSPDFNEITGTVDWFLGGDRTFTIRR